MSRLQGKTALIAGGNSGIGLATARLFLREGAEVAITGRNAETLAEAERELDGRVLAMQADVSSMADLDRLYAALGERFGRLDVLFANAGVATPCPLEEFTEELFESIFVGEWIRLQLATADRFVRRGRHYITNRNEFRGSGDALKVRAWGTLIVPPDRDAVRRFAEA